MAKDTSLIDELERKYAYMMNPDRIEVGNNLVCSMCNKTWKHEGSPAICPSCNKSSFAIMKRKAV